MLHGAFSARSAPLVPENALWGLYEALTAEFSELEITDETFDAIQSTTFSFPQRAAACLVNQIEDVIRLSYE